MFPYLSSVVQLSLGSNICLVTTRFTFHIKFDVFKTCQSLIIFSNEFWQSHQGRTSLVAIFSELDFALKKNNQRMLLSKNYIFDTCKKLFIRSITNVQKIFIQGLYLTYP